MSDKWPSFFIIGAPRAGTTSLYEYLKQIPSLYLPAMKEPNFFNINLNPKLILTKPVRCKRKYLKLFASAPDHATAGEATPTYLWDPMAPRLIHEAVPQARIIMILRHPVERGFSHYLHLCSLGNAKMSFRQEVEQALKAEKDYSGRIIEAGMYSQQVRRYLEMFGRDQVKIILFEEFVKNIQGSVKEILHFLQVSSKPPESPVFHVHNPFTAPKGKFASYMLHNRALRALGRNLVPHRALPFLKPFFSKKMSKPELTYEDRNFVQEIYHEDVRELETLIEREVHWLGPLQERNSEIKCR